MHIQCSKLYILCTTSLTNIWQDWDSNPVPPSHNRIEWAIGAGPCWQADGGIILPVPRLWWALNESQRTTQKPSYIYNHYSRFNINAVWEVYIGSWEIPRVNVQRKTKPKNCYSIIVYRSSRYSHYEWIIITSITHEFSLYCFFVCAEKCVCAQKQTVTLARCKAGIRLNLSIIRASDFRYIAYTMKTNQINNW